MGGSKCGDREMGRPSGGRGGAGKQRLGLAVDQVWAEK